MLLGALIVGVFYLYEHLTTTDRLAIENIEFLGLHRLNQDEVRALVADVEGQNILLVALENYTARFDQHPRIETIEMRKILPDRVVCTVKEREPIALVYANRFLEVDRGGMIMTADGLTDQLDLPIVTGLDPEAIEEGKPCVDPHLAGALRVLEVCKEYGGRFAENISELRVSKDGISVVLLKEDMVLLLGESEFESRLRKFFLMKQTIVARNQSAKLIDLRFDDQIVLRSGI